MVGEGEERCGVGSKAENASSRQFDFDSIERAQQMPTDCDFQPTIWPSNFDFKFVTCKRPSEPATFDSNSGETSAGASPAIRPGQICVRIVGPKEDLEKRLKVSLEELRCGF